MRMILNNPVLFWTVSVLTLGNFYSYHKGRKNGLHKARDPYADLLASYCSRPVRGNAKKGTNY